MSPQTRPEKRLAVCLLASEVTPLSKTGGLADVAGALAKTLSGAGHDVRVFTPAYASVDRAACAARPVPQLQKLRVTVGVQSFACAVLRGRLPGGAPVYLIDCPALFARPTLYTADADEHVRFLAFTRAALSACREMRWAPRVVHCNDWHTSFAPLLLRTSYAREPLFSSARTLLTIHNIGYQGIFAAAQVADLNLTAAELPLLYAPDLAAGRINALRHGILYADAINTVSPTHAREIASPEYGMGLEDSLRARSAVLSGILNGVDYAEWDPRNDAVLPAHYDPQHLAVKARLKAEFLGRHGLNSDPGVPLAGIVSRLAAQKGIELMFSALPSVLAARPLNFVALGSGEAQYESFFRALARDFPGRVHFHRGYDDALAHWIEAASDMFLMPSRYEPCGLNQMYSLRYGTVPIVRRTGGLADSVAHFDAHSGEGTGIVFNDFDSPALEWALHTALDLYAQPDNWARLVQNGMAQDFSWARQAQAYVGLYERLTDPV
jgi:starch synthase